MIGYDQAVWMLKRMLKEAVRCVPANQRDVVLGDATDELIGYLFGCGNMPLENTNAEVFLAGFMAGYWASRT